jgi:hypothetical protein
MSDATAAVAAAPQPDAAWSWQRQGALAAILIAAAAIRLAELNVQSLSSDEVKDLAMARGGVARLAASDDRFPPLYHALLSGWLRLVPWDETGRGFSVLCGVLTVAAVAGLAAELGGAAAGLWAAAITAAAPLPAWYAVEARAYALFMLLAVVVLWQLAAAIGRHRLKNWIAFAAAATAGAYTHYYFGLLIAIAGLAWLASRPRGAAFRRGIAAFAAIAVATAPSLWLLKQDLDHPWGYARNSAFSLPALGYTYFSYLSGYTLGPSLRALHMLSARDAALAAAPWIVGVGACVGVLLALALRQTPPCDRMRRVALLAAFCIAPAAIIGGVSVAAGFGYNVRHAVWAFAPLAAALSIGAAYGRPRWLAWTAAVLMFAAFAVAHLQRIVRFEHRNEDMRSVAERLTAVEAPRPTFVLSGYMSKPLAAYLPAKFPVFALPDAETSEHAADAAIAAVRRHAQPGQAVWLVYTRGFHGDPRGEMLAELKRVLSLDDVGRFAGADLYQGTAP